jgi:RNA polymerase sigma-70 factor, ECF subfamily
VPDDATLLRCIAQGNQESLHVLYQRYQPRLRRYLWRQLGGDLLLAEDTVQEVFLAVWRYSGGYRGEASVAVWLFRIAHHCASHARRAQSRRPESHQLRLPEDDEPDHLSAAIGVRTSLEDEVVSRLTFTEALQQLSEKHREVLTLIFQQGFTLEEVAHILDIPTGTVKSRVSYARQALLKELAATREDHER